MDKIITWEEFDKMAEDIYQNFKDQNIKQIVGLSRGGLTLAVKLSHLLGVPMTTLTWQTRDSGMVRDTNELLKLLESEHLEDILFVDDICDTGLTINQIKLFIPKSKWVVLVTKKPFIVDYAVEEMVCDDRWVIFPWENQRE